MAADPARVQAIPAIQGWVSAWWPALLWAAIIFSASTDTFSSQNTSRFIGPTIRWLYPAIAQDQLDLINIFIRKCAHVAEYAVFYPLVLRGLARGRTGWLWSRGLGALLIVAVYSGLDEFHQSFVASRTSSPWDSLLDSAGAFVAMLVVFCVSISARRRRSQSTPGASRDRER
jgi:VanZ family protein